LSEDVVSQTSERIIAIINEHMKNVKKGGLAIRLENMLDECDPPKLKLRLHILNNGVQLSQIMSSCLSPDDIGKIQEKVENFCRMKQVEYRMKND
jgi:hypothetical protein